MSVFSKYLLFSLSKVTPISVIWIAPFITWSDRTFKLNSHLKWAVNNSFTASIPLPSIEAAIILTFLPSFIPLIVSFFSSPSTISIDPSSCWSTFHSTSLFNALDGVTFAVKVIALPTTRKLLSGLIAIWVTSVWENFSIKLDGSLIIFSISIIFSFIFSYSILCSS